MKETNLKVKHQRKAAYKQLFSDALPLNSYGEALQVKNERFCQLFKLANKRMNHKQLFSDALPLNSYGEALQKKNERFCQLFKLANKRMNQ